MIELQEIYSAYKNCRKGKSAGRQAQVYEASLIDNLFNTKLALQSSQWKPKKMRTFQAYNGGKAREIHAPSFSDRVVHHYLVEKIQPLFEPIFIHNCAANRKNKGTHFAIHQLKKIINQDKKLYYLQLDVYNFFYSIDKNILFSLLDKRLTKSLNQQKISLDNYQFYIYLLKIIIFQSNQEHYNNSQVNSINIPQHKILANCEAKNGIPIGSLTSQFFSNVYLNELDQYIKHTLKVKHYIRYVDDFILLHRSKQELNLWHYKIKEFLEQELNLKLKKEYNLKTVNQGINFLGYISKPHYLLIRRRVVNNFKEKLNSIYNQLAIQDSNGIIWNLNEEKIEQLRAIVASYIGHFKHAHSLSLLNKILTQFIWLQLFFKQKGVKLMPIWQTKEKKFKDQINHFLKYYPLFDCLIQKGNQRLFFPSSINTQQYDSIKTPVEREFCQNRPYIYVHQIKHQNKGCKIRSISKIHIIHNDSLFPSRETVKNLASTVIPAKAGIYLPFLSFYFIRNCHTNIDCRFHGNDGTVSELGNENPQSFV